MAAPSDPTAGLIGLLQRLYWEIGDHTRQEARANGLRVAELGALRTIRDSSAATPATVASAIHLTRSTMTGVIDRLEARGWVQRQRSATDRRKTVLQLTEAGHAKASELGGALPVDLLERIATLPPTDRQRLERILAELMLDPEPTRLPAGAIAR